jgi:CNP1-like family
MTSLKTITTIWASTTMTKRPLAIALLLVFYSMAAAQLTADDPDWKETEVPPPPSFDLKRLVQVDVSLQSQLKWGVDPSTIVINKDGVVRYVVVAQSASGVVNAMYEGIRCSKAEFRRYARHNPDSGWVKVTDSDWTPLRQSGTSRHPQALAKLGLCDGAAPPISAQQATRSLRAGGNNTGQ